MEDTRPDEPLGDIQDDIVFLQEQVEIVQNACRVYDINTINHALNALTGHQFSKEKRSLIDQLKTFVLRGEYENAEVLTHEILKNM
jgi:hypothetical protein